MDKLRIDGLASCAIGTVISTERHDGVTGVKQLSRKHFELVPLGGNAHEDAFGDGAGADVRIAVRIGEILRLDPDDFGIEGVQHRSGVAFRKRGIEILDQFDISGRHSRKVSSVCHDGTLAVPARPLLTMMILVLAMASVASPCSTPPAPLVITGVTLVDGGRAVPHQEIVFAQGRVAAVGQSGRVKRPMGARVIDARGDSLMPGLIDAHAHLYELGGPSPRAMYESPRENAFPITARQLLRSGVTAARVHLFDRVHGPALKRDAENDCYPSPRLRIGGPGLIAAQPQMQGSYFHGYTSLPDAFAKLAAMREAGADWVAFHSLDRFPLGELDAIAAEAHRLGLMIMAEGGVASRVELALRIKAESIDYVDRSAAGTYSTELMRAMRESGTQLVPPVGFYNRSVAVRRADAGPPDPLWFSFMPDAVAAEIRSRYPQWIAKPSDSDAHIEVINRRFQDLVKAGVPMAIGTDCGSPANFQVDAIWWELETRRKLGMSAAAAIQSATENGARLLRLPDAGHLRPGARADFILYRGNLDEGRMEVRRVRMVGKGGVLFVDQGEWTGH